MIVLVEGARDFPGYGELIFRQNMKFVKLEHIFDILKNSNLSFSAIVAIFKHS